MIVGFSFEPSSLYNQCYLLTVSMHLYCTIALHVVFLWVDLGHSKGL